MKLDLRMSQDWNLKGLVPSLVEHGARADVFARRDLGFPLPACLGQIHRLQRHGKRSLIDRKNTETPGRADGHTVQPEFLHKSSLSEKMICRIQRPPG